jgi:hypothetical protein
VPLPPPPAVAVLRGVSGAEPLPGQLATDLLLGLAQRATCCLRVA